MSVWADHCVVFPQCSYSTLEPFVIQMMVNPKAEKESESENHLIRHYACTDLERYVFPASPLLMYSL